MTVELNHYKTTMNERSKIILKQQAKFAEASIVVSHSGSKEAQDIH